MPSNPKKPTLPKPPTPWAKKRKSSNPLQQPVVAKSAKPQVQPTTKASLEETPVTPTPVAVTPESTPKVTALPLSSKPSPSTPTTKSIGVIGRRPDYKHHLVGLSVGDQIVFHKNPTLKASIVDLDNKVTFNGTEYDGIIPAAEEAYRVSGLTPPKRVTGLSEWRNPDGIRLRVLYEKLKPVYANLTVQTFSVQPEALHA